MLQRLPANCLITSNPGAPVVELPYTLNCSKVEARIWVVYTRVESLALHITVSIFRLVTLVVSVFFPLSQYNPTITPI